MKVFAILGAAVLLLSLGTIAPVSAQQKQEESKQQRPQAKQQQQRAQPQRQQQAKQQQQRSQPQRQQQAKQQQQRAQPQRQQQAKEQQRTARPQRTQAGQQQAHRLGQPPARHTQEQERVQHAAWQQHRSRDWQSDHRTWQQRGGYNGYRIPDNRYSGYFGSDHGFVIFRQPYMVVGGFPRFQYSGYWFSLVDPWPQYWASNWYETDDVYVVYENNGYYMYNRRYPGFGMAISVSL